ncbi:unnamed protein product [Adineta steineri]|uniref:G protein gamma domain-containing protein n=1 Tax=Adineta steineri TaxID=433720 RepID=A0A815VU90_9BILA|nr:unnamed protein product [Adineta steineri]CAF1269988.1 unnamed protein product [Adineta steineri]CAF1286315.1 unnamed protein product [Adineta steineri]CAF1309080.1 unnamed protein product [Adineta steineri]CAF1534903.1 unnamed protein product [Adineta steineri]
MSFSQTNNTTSFTQLSASHENLPSRRVSDNFSSSRSYAPEYHTQTTYTSQRRLCEHLREEAKRERVKVSIVCKDLVRYVTDHQSNDALVIGFQSPKDNPFRDKQKCSLL